MSEDKEYSVRVDGQEIDKVKLSPRQYKSRRERDMIRDMIADHHGMESPLGLRLIPIEDDYIFATDMNTGVSSKFYTNKQDNDIDSSRPIGYVKTTKGNT